MAVVETKIVERYRKDATHRALLYEVAEKGVNRKESEIGIGILLLTALLSVSQITCQ
jgi:hypothetical protein